MVEKDELLYVTGWEVTGNKTKNTEGCGMNKTTVRNPIHNYEYKEDGVVLASGDDIESVVLDYLQNYLGYVTDDIESDYEWRDYPSNTNYSVCELGIIVDKRTGKVVNSAFKDVYKVDDKNVWRLRTSVNGIGTIKVSSVVAETFLGDKPEDGDYIVGHKNDVAIDNRAENLEYITSDYNKTIDWVLREVIRRGLNVRHVEDVYGQILEVLEDKYGEGFEVEELTDEDELEVAEHIDIYKRSVREIYRYKKYGTGVLANLIVFEGRFYV